jgi:hypothetical protein
MDIGSINLLSDSAPLIVFDQIGSCLEQTCLNDSDVSIQVLLRASHEGFQPPFYGLADLKGRCLNVRTPNA